MKLKKAQARYKLPPFHDIETVYVEGNQRHNQMFSVVMRRVRLGELPNEGETTLGMPTIFAVGRDIIEFYPPPDKPYVVKVRYLPPLQEF